MCCLLIHFIEKTQFHIVFLVYKYQLSVLEGKICTILELWSRSSKYEDFCKLLYI